MVREEKDVVLLLRRSSSLCQSKGSVSTVSIIRLSYGGRNMEYEKDVVS